jgi:hypothetical protein
LNALTKIEAAPGNVEMFRASTDAASICRDIVVATATVIQGRKYVNVEGWQAIAIAHGCAAGARDVEKVDGGVRAIGEIRRMSDGAVISVAEGFVGEDEETWYGGKNRWGKELPKRADYAIRAMAQTRAISRACRSAFAHVVVMMNAGLATTPAEEVPAGGFNDDAPAPAPAEQPRQQQRQEQRQEPQEEAQVFITAQEQAELIALAEPKGIDTRRLCEVGGIDALPSMTPVMFRAAKAWVAKQPSKPVADDILDDHVPY